MAENRSLESITLQLQRVQAEQRAIRQEMHDFREEVHNDLAVMSAMIQRMESTMRGFVSGIRAEQAGHEPMDRPFTSLNPEDRIT